MSYPSLEISKNKLKVIVRLTKILLLKGNIHKEVQSKALYIGNELSQKSFTDNFTDTVTVEEDRTDIFSKYNSYKRRKRKRNSKSSFF